MADPLRPDPLDQYFPEMRWRCLSLAADLDRVSRDGQLPTDPRIAKLRQAIGVLLRDAPGGRAEEVQLIFSDRSPPPLSASPPSRS